MPIQLRFNIDDPVDMGVFSSKRDGVVTVDLGDCVENGLSYSLFCSLHPTIFPGRMEFAFWLADYDPNTGQMDKIWNGADTKHLIVGRDRGFVMQIVAQALKHLVEIFAPQYVFIQAMDPNLPEAALRKYYLLGDVLTASGYQFWRLSPYHDREAWLAQRMEQ